MSNCDDNDDNRPASPDLLAEAVASATEFLLDSCPGEATLITRGPGGEHGAIFVVRDPDDVAEFIKLYMELFRGTEDRIDVVACNVPPDYESN